MQYIAFDSHKRYTYAVVEDQEKGCRVMEQRITHRKGEIREFLSHCEPNSPVALETIGSWYWIVDEIEAAGMVPRLVNAWKAKMMLASSKKTDRLDAKGLNTLQRATLLQTIPSIGPILSHVIAYETGDITRFPSAACYASYAGTTPSVHASGGKVRYGHTPADVNHYLHWAFVEAANILSMRHEALHFRHVAQLYERLKATKGHGIAIGAVARHLAEATYWVLTTKSAYREPHHTNCNTVVSSKKG